MRWQELNRQTGLRGEGLPYWAVFGLLLFGVVLSIATAWSLMPRIGVGITALNRDNASSTPPAITRHTENAEPSVERPAVKMDWKPEINKNTVVPGHTVTGSGGGEPIIQRVPPAVGSPHATSSEPESTKMHSGIQSVSIARSGCPPAFDVRFKRNGIHPIDLHLPKKVTRLIAWLDTHPDTKVRIEGHASAGGPDEFNLILSYRRANSIAELLIKAGIPSDHIITRAMGDRLPLQGIPPKSGKNQRVSLHIEGAHECSVAWDEENIQ